MFRGKRLLVQAGTGWSLKKECLEARPSLLYHKAYLRLHQMKGFTKAEAQNFLLEKKQLNLSDEQLQAIIERSSMDILDTSSVALTTAIDWIPLRIARLAKRINPFELSLYGDWLCE